MLRAAAELSKRCLQREGRVDSKLPSFDVRSTALFFFRDLVLLGDQARLCAWLPKGDALSRRLAQMLLVLQGLRREDSSEAMVQQLLQERMPFLKVRASDLPPLPSTSSQRSVSVDSDLFDLSSRPRSLSSAGILPDSPHGPTLRCCSNPHTSRRKR